MRGRRDGRRGVDKGWRGVGGGSLGRGEVAISGVVGVWRWREGSMGSGMLGLRWVWRWTLYGV